jgi:hypothetical protein
MGSLLSVHAGMDVRRLLERHADAALGALVPLSRTGNERQRQLSKAVLEAGIVIDTFGGVLGLAIFPCLQSMHASHPAIPHTMLLSVGNASHATSHSS